jgi:hypothetical protein
MLRSPCLTFSSDPQAPFRYGRASPVDSPPPPPPPRPAYVYAYAATDERPRTPEEAKLCAKASEPDWLYMGASVVLTAGAITLDTVARGWTQEAPRYIGPAAVGLTWGFTLGGSYLALPKCAPDYIAAPPPEGDVRTDWLVAAAFMALAGLTAPVVEAIETGTVPTEWKDGERVGRLALASGFGMVGSLLPYLLPPKTWRAAKELEHLRASPSADGRGGFVSWSVRF